MQHIKDYMNKINMLVKYNSIASSKKKKKTSDKSAGFAAPKDTTQQPDTSSNNKELKIIAGYVQGIREARAGMLNHGKQ
jgi:hypothetical protein